MSNPQSNQSQSLSRMFPYKTLLWVLFATVVIFVFKNPLIKILSEAEEVTIWDKIKIKVSKGDVKRLQAAQEEYQQKIKDLTGNIEVQNEMINSLSSIINQLENDMKNCPEITEQVSQFNVEFMKMKTINTEIRTNSDQLRESSLLKLDKVAIRKIR